ncbi:MAG: amidohydrolase family protein [Dehalococcoidia bacterium]|nr:amidohydrolase family protein [Dehalococcoidia bacterium]
MADLVIKNGIVVTSQGLVRGGLAVEGGKIAQVSGDMTLPSAKQEVDAGGNYILPGMIDPHVHLGMAATGRGEDKFRADFASESASAAIGGVTTMITTAYFSGAGRSLLPCIARSKEIGAQQSLIDFKFSAMMMTSVHLTEIPKLFEAGVTSFKFFPVYRGEEGRQVGVTEEIGWDYIYKGMEGANKCGPQALSMIHAEEPGIIDVLRQRFKEQGRNDPRAWAESRPGICEAMHIFSGGLTALELGARVYFVHVSAKESVEAIQYFKRKGAQLYGETCPHYLLLTKDSEIGVLGKVNPPLHEAEDNRQIWRGLQDGTFDAIGSDHSSNLRWQKEKGDIWSTMPGFPTIGASLALLVSEGVNKGRLSWEQLARVTSENTARIFGLYPRKGTLAPGADADIVIVDPNREWELNAENLKSASDYSIYAGKVAKGKAVKTFVRGKLVADDGRAVAQGSHGVYVA